MNLQKLTSMDGGVYRIANQIWKLMIINFLNILFIIPLITIVPSILATFEVLLNPDYDSITIKEYFNKVKKHLKRGITIFSIQILVIVSIVITLRFSPSFLEFPLIFILGIAILLFQVTYPVAATVEGGLKQIFRFSTGILMKYTGYIAISVTIFFAFTLLPIFLPKLVFIWLIFGLSLPEFFISKIFKIIFVRLDLIEMGN